MRQQQNNELMVTGRDLSLSSVNGGGPDTLEITQFGGGGGGDGAGSGQAQVNPLHKLHMLLKGRYKWAISLAVVGALGGATAGFLIGKQIHVSYGYIEVLPSLPKIMADSDGTLPFFDSFVDAQMQTMQSQRVLDMAVQNEAWRSTGKSTGPDMVEKISEDLEIFRGKGSQLIRVGFSDENPAVAQAAVRSVLESYEKVAAEQDLASGEKVLELLQREQATKSAQAQGYRQQILALADPYGTDDLSKKYDFHASELEKLDQTRQQLQLMLASMGESGTSPTAETTTRPTSELQPAEIAMRDGLMAQLLTDRRMIERRMALITKQLGPNHRDMAKAQIELELIDDEIEARAEEFRKLVASGLVPMPVAQQQPGGGPAMAAVEQVTPEMVKARLAQVQKLFDQKKQELLELGKVRLKIDAFREQEAVLKDQVEQFKRRQEQLALQDKVAGRIRIVNFGERPKVLKDMRIKLAGGLGFGGAALGFGAVVLLGLLDRRFRNPEELQTSLTGSPMLGVLPELPDDLSDPQQAALTAHFVHQIRTLLQIWDSGAGTQVFSITSPVSGTGKTSLTLALGVSFAASDSRTLLIDCDLVGGGLTTRANAIVKRRIGRILQREGLLTDKQLEEALKLANGSRRRLGEILVELGYLKEADLDSALVTQQKGNVGLLDAINGEDLKECVAETGIPGLSILPLGAAQAHHASKVTPHNLRRVLSEARKHYDTILIDTGPVPGSLEAAVVAAEVDGVILCVSRGEQRPLAEKCVQHLLSIGAKVAGVVFNRAKTTDMNVYGTAVRTSMPATSVPAAGGDSARFGPMAHAVTYGGGSDADAGANGGTSAGANTEAGKR